MLQLRALDTLGGGDHDWLRARHHFAVDSRGNSAHARLGNLARVLGATAEAGQRIAYPMPRPAAAVTNWSESDGLAIAGEPRIAITAIEPAEIILVDTTCLAAVARWS